MIRKIASDSGNARTERHRACAVSDSGNARTERHRACAVSSAPLGPTGSAPLRSVLPAPLRLRLINAPGADFR